MEQSLSLEIFFGLNMSSLTVQEAKSFRNKVKRSELPFQKMLQKNHEFDSTFPTYLGVPQGTVLGPLMFLLYVNDIGEGVNSEIKIFADDCLLYRTIESESDTKQLREDLSKMTECSKKWLLRLNAKKCYVMRFKRSRLNIVFINNYNNDGSTLD